MQLKEIMTREVEAVRPETAVKEAAELMRTLEIGTLLVSTGDRLVGVLTDRDITVRAVTEGGDTMSMPVCNVMTPEVAYCFEDQDVTEAARVMEERQVRRLPVLDRNKRLVGIISLDDLATGAGDATLAGEVLKEVSELDPPRRRRGTIR
jgi:CBS domain-containing protein